jgi:hypothetical protein
MGYYRKNIAFRGKRKMSEKQPKFVTTRAEYQFDTEVDDYVLVEKEGYWHDGEWALADFSQPSPPPAPDPVEIAQTDARFNRIDQFTPFGNLTFSGPDRNVSTLNFSPEVQALFDQRLQSDSNVDLSQFGPIQSQIDQSKINFQGPQIGNLPGLQAPNLQGVANNVNLTQGFQSPFELQNQVDLSLQTGGLPQIPQNIEQFRGDVEQAVFNRGQRLLDPVFQDQERRLTQDLANRGLPEFGEAANKASDRFTQQRDRALADLVDQATITGGNQASRALADVLSARGQGFGEEVTGANLNLAGGQFGNQAAGQGFNQAFQQAGFGNQAQLAQLQAALGATGFNNQTGLLGLGANQGIRGQLFGEGLNLNQAQNQASGLNLGLQQQLLQNQNAARSQGLAEAQGVRGNQFNELAALLGLQQVQTPQQQNFFAPGQADVLGGFGLQQQALQNAFNADSARANAGLGGLFGLGSAALLGPFSEIFT